MIPLLMDVEFSRTSFYQCYKLFWKKLDNSSYLVVGNIQLARALRSWTSCICEIIKVSYSSPLRDKFHKVEILTTWLTCIKCDLMIWTQKIISFNAHLPWNSSKMDRLIYASPSEDKSTLSLFATSLLFWIPPELNSSIEKKELWHLPISEFESSRLAIWSGPWLYSSVENNELLHNGNRSTENRKFLLDVEDNLTRVKTMKFFE